jgi:uncharacterized LabA/DUF88 family protein
MLFPMIHIGAAEYFREVQDRLVACDVVIHEGVRSFRTRLLTASYRWVTLRTRLQLVAQNQGLRLSQLDARLVLADVTGEEFGAGWRKIPRCHRLALLVLAPAYGLWLYLTASRTSLGARQGSEDLASRNDILRGESIPGFREAVLTSRDKRLISSIDAVIAEGKCQEMVGVVYGAAHMPPVVHHLMSTYGYKVACADWISVMGYEDDA